VACAVGPSVTTSSTDFSFQNLVFGNLFEISATEITLKSISPPFWIQILPNKFHQILLIKIFPTTPNCTFQFLWNFKLQFNLIFSEEIIQYSRTFAPQVQTPWNQAHAPLLVESFPKTPRTWSEASQFGGSHNYNTKQNKLPSFIDRSTCRNRKLSKSIKYSTDVCGSCPSRLLLRVLQFAASDDQCNMRQAHTFILGRVAATQVSSPPSCMPLIRGEKKNSSDFINCSHD